MQRLWRLYKTPRVLALEKMIKAKTMEDKRVRYLRQREKQYTRTMYEAVFPEDSQKFVDYYYNWKTRDNEIVVMEGTEDFESSFFQVMLHLNPYTLWINGKYQKLSYIVAVATDPKFRRQGKMNQVMEYALQDMGSRRVPFTFLLPADPAYYRGQGFVFFPCQGFDSTGKDKMLEAASAKAVYTKRGHLAKEFRWRQAQIPDISNMAFFSNRVLKQRCDIFIKRDCYYYQRLLAETEAEHGGVLLLEAKGRLFGLLTYAFTDYQYSNDTDHCYGESDCQGKVKAEIKELLVEASILQMDTETFCRDAFSSIGIRDSEIQSMTFSDSQMMVRITDLHTFVPLLQSEGNRSFYVKVTDSIIDSNCGCFEIKLAPDGGRIERISEKSVQCEMDIADITRELLKDTSVYLNEWV